ncbi:ARPP-2 domain-containing protein [Agarilytica rhodophyticola]|uniref:ARPP-2 domain-containing protein n=1 Tax=Agarilytica rhodophyticola TaxID=1737490 RepID=UPI000B343608|nr:hypothetical protein [Agarilytica rhodophyticola]
MTNNTRTLKKISLQGFELTPSQIWGNVRLVPVIKKKNTENLRLGLRQYEAPYSVVCLDGKAPLQDTKSYYYSYIPSALIATWTTDQTKAKTYGCQLEKIDGPANFGARLEERLAKKEGNRQLRFLPLHLAMEGFLGLHFSGPDFKWDEYSEIAMRQGLVSRHESSIDGYDIEGFDEALRLFEIHPQQVGVVVFVSDALASIFILPNNGDYHVLHKMLLQDFYAEILFHYGQHRYQAPNLATIEDNFSINSHQDLHNLIEKTRKSAQQQYEGLLHDVLDREISSKVIKRLGKFRLQRFSTNFDTDKLNFIGEAITGPTGSLEYLKTYQLSNTQTRRAYILKTLAENDWNLEATGKTIGCSKKDIIRRLHQLGFAYLLKGCPHN